jgi:hypothetical protein
MPSKRAIVADRMTDSQLWLRLEMNLAELRPEAVLLRHHRDRNKIVDESYVLVRELKLRGTQLQLDFSLRQ